MSTELISILATWIDARSRFRTLLRRMKNTQAITLMVFLATAGAVCADVLPGLSLGVPFKDGMVLQRERPVPVWGTATPEATVSVTFAGQARTAKADAKGAWRVTLDALAASRESRQLTVVAGEGSRCVVSDVVVGEVWLCSGQSNMDMALADDTPRYGDGIGRMVAQVTDKPLVRYLSAPGKGGWHAFTPGFLSQGRKAALPVHYALELYAQLEIPVGVVVAASGGSNIDSWNPSEGEKANLHRAMIVDFAPYAIRGVLWYQGETNLREEGAYLPKLRQLYRGWRSLFGIPDLPFHYVQLAPYAYGKDKDGVDRDPSFPKFLVAQAAFEKEEPNASMVVINDIGNVTDIHPGNKWLVAKRLALPALKRCYGRTQIEDHSPVPVRATAVSNVVDIAFDHAKTLYVYNPNERFDLSVPFELAGDDGTWHPAIIVNFARRDWTRHGNVDTNVLSLVAADVSRPMKVRYAWRRPWKGIVYNQVNLPLGTFEADVMRSPEDVFAHPPHAADVGVWWHWMGSQISEEGIVKDLDYFRRMGIGYATIFGMADTVEPWATPVAGGPFKKVVAFTPGWWKFVKFACREGRRRGIEIGVHNCPGYTSTGGPWIPPRLAMRELVFNVSETNPVPLAAHADYPIWDAAHGRFGVPDEPSRRTDLVDIATVNGVRISHVPMGAFVQPSQEESRGLECDKMNPEAVAFHLDHVIGEMKRHLGDEVGKGLTYVLLDSYEAGTPTWTPNMAAEFKARRGYDCVPFLPVLGGFHVADAATEAKFRRDFDETRKDLYRDALFSVMREKLAAAGLKFECEPYGGPFRREDGVAAVDRPMFEF